MIRTRITYLFTALLFLTAMLLSLFIYLQDDSAHLPKSLFCQLTQTTNLSIANETRAIRFRNEADLFSLFGDSPESREYFPTTFVYHYSSRLEK